MKAIAVIKYDNFSLAVCKHKDTVRLLVPNSLLSKSKASGEGYVKSLKKFLNEAKKNFSCSVMEFNDNQIEKIVEEYNKEKNKVINVVSDLDLDESWSYIEDVFNGFDPDSDVRDHIAVVRKNSKSNTIFIYLTPDVSGDEELQDAYRSISFNFKNLDWAIEKRQVNVDQKIIKYLYSQFKSSIQRRSLSTSSDSQNKDDALDLIRSAIERRATDIHVFFREDRPSLVKFRIDSRLVHFNEFAHTTTLYILRTIFNLFGQSVTKLGFSQHDIQDVDAVLSLEVLGEVKDITLRWQSTPDDDGLKVVLRILDNDTTRISKMDYVDMGYADLHRAMLNASIQTKVGFILTTGTTGSGKNTTNLKLLTEMDKQHPEWAYNTVEDPIEYRIPNVSQHQVKMDYVKGDPSMGEQEKKKLAFNALLSALMRLDPDVIGIGEVRDATTAEIVRDFVNTGHKILATLHADSVLYTYDRLEHIGLDRDTLCRPGFFSLIIYQSLFPKTCTHCGIKFEDANVPDYYKDSLRTLFYSDVENIKFHNPNGCDHCNNGIKGMTLCAEMLIPDEKISLLIRDKKYPEARKYWVEEMPPIDLESEYQGHTIEDHILWQVKKGVICPYITSTSLPDLTIVARKKYPFLEPGYKFGEDKVYPVKSQKVRSH